MEREDFPEVLDPTKYYYPPELFDDLEIEQENGEKIREPINLEEEPLLMAKFAVASSLGLPCSEETLVKIARGERKKSSFMADVRKAQFGSYGGQEGMYKGDIELQAEELGVYEVIWPFDPEKMREAIEAERRGEPILGLDTEVVADAVDDVGDDDLRLDQVVINA